MLDIIEYVRNKNQPKPSVVKDILRDIDDCVLFAEVSNGELVIRVRKKNGSKISLIQSDDI